MDLTRLHTLGNRDLLKLRKVAFLCSRTCPSGMVAQACAWAATERAKGSCVISGFHSPVEKEVLQELLTGTQPLILALARGFSRTLDADLGTPLAQGRLLVLTRYARSVTHPSEESCHQRNRLMLELCDEAVIGYASPGGKLEKLCAEFSGARPIAFIT